MIDPKKAGFAVSFAVGFTLTWVVVCILGGCFTRTVYVPSGKPVKLRQEIKGAKIWAKDSEGKFVPGTLDLKEGWVIVPNDIPEIP